MATLLYLLSIITTGLFSGLMMTLVVIMQKQWKTMNQKDYYVNFKNFLIVAKGNPLVTILTLYSFSFPIIAGVISIFKHNTLIGILFLVSGIIFLCGCFIVTMKLNFPIYKTVIAWKSENDATDWISIRSRFYKLNIIRFISSLTAFCVLSVAILLINFA